MFAMNIFYVAKIAGRIRITHKQGHQNFYRQLWIANAEE